MLNPIEFQWIPLNSIEFHEPPRSWCSKSPQISILHFAGGTQISSEELFFRFTSFWMVQNMSPTEANRPPTADSTWREPVWIMVDLIWIIVDYCGLLWIIVELMFWFRKNHQWFRMVSVVEIKSRKGRNTPGISWGVEVDYLNCNDKVQGPIRVVTRKRSHWAVLRKRAILPGRRTMKTQEQICWRLVCSYEP